MLPALLYDQFRDPAHLNRQPLDHLLQTLVRVITDGLTTSAGQYTLAIPLVGADILFVRLANAPRRMSWVPSRLGGPAKLVAHTPHQQVSGWILEALTAHYPHLITQLIKGQLAVTAVSTIDQLRIDFCWSPIASPLDLRCVTIDRSE